MLRTVANPPNPYQSAVVEWLGPPPPVEVQVFEEEAKSILAQNDSPDVGFRWSLNPYRGCVHACAYCYARPQHEYLGYGAGTDFESRIVVKVNAPERLRVQFLHRSWKGELIAFSGDTDCYQAFEASYRLTRRCLEVCAEFKNPVGVITKSPLVRRDIDVLAQLAAIGAARVTMSIAFHDDALARKIEPGAPPPRLRFEALKALADAGIPTSVLLAPIIPGLNDGQIPAVLEAAAAAGARSAGMLLVRLPGSVREVFFSRLAEALPDRAARVESRIREARGGDAVTDPRYFHRHHGTGTYWQAISDLFALHQKRLGLDDRECGTVADTFERPERQLELF